MSQAAEINGVPPPEYQSQEPPPAESRSRSKSLMGLADPAISYNPKDEKKKGVGSNIGKRESSWDYVLTHESVVEGEARHERDYSFIYSEGHGSVSKFTGFGQGGTILKGKNTEAPRSFWAHMNSDKHFVIESESFPGDPEMLLNIIANTVQNHSRFTFTWDPTSGRRTLATEPEVEDRDIGDDIVSCPSSAKKNNNRPIKARKGKGQERGPQTQSKTQAAFDENLPWKCCKCWKEGRGSKLHSKEERECKIQGCGHQRCGPCPIQGSGAWDTYERGYQGHPRTFA